MLSHCTHSHSAKFSQDSNPTNHSLSWTPIDENVENNSGIVTKSLVDLQRLLACAMVLKGEDSNDVKKGLRDVITSTFVSARVNMIMKSNDAVTTDSALCDLLPFLWCKAHILHLRSLTHDNVGMFQESLEQRL